MGVDISPTVLTVECHKNGNSPPKPPHTTAKFWKQDSHQLLISLHIFQCDQLCDWDPSLWPRLSVWTISMRHSFSLRFQVTHHAPSARRHPPPPRMRHAHGRTIVWHAQIMSRPSYLLHLNQRRWLQSYQYLCLKSTNNLYSPSLEPLPQMMIQFKPANGHLIMDVITDNKSNKWQNVSVSRPTVPWFAHIQKRLFVIRCCW